MNDYSFGLLLRLGAGLSRISEIAAVFGLRTLRRRTAIKFLRITLDVWHRYARNSSAEGYVAALHDFYHACDRHDPNALPAALEYVHDNFAEELTDRDVWLLGTLAEIGAAHACAWRTGTVDLPATN